jgi:hypothetical protein
MYLNLILVFISVTTYDVEHIFICLLTFWISSFVVCLLKFIFVLKLFSKDSFGQPFTVAQLVVLTTWEVEVRRIMVQDQTEQK